MDLDHALNRLDHRFRLSLEQAWSSLGRRGLPVGAVVALEDEVVSAGRNRVFDPPGGPDPLQRTPLAHAEMNALASLSNDTDFARCSMWSTHAPCPMCEAAIEFAGLASVQFLANDPSVEDLGGPSSAAAADASLWTVVANVMFLHNVAWVSGRDNPIVARYVRQEPEIAGLALSILDAESFIRVSTGGGDLIAGLAAAWSGVIEANDSRLGRG
jgi:tRNA(Arg) A34 adenosine deaminase TadA